MEAPLEGPAMTAELSNSATPAPGARPRGLTPTFSEARIEIVTVISLSIAALLTSWAGYQAALWDGQQAMHYSRANSIRTAAAGMETASNQLTLLDIFQFAEWTNAYAAGDQRLEAFYRARFRPEFKPAFEAWAATRPQQYIASPETPFTMPQYHLATRGQSKALLAKAEAEMTAGQRANRTGDAFVQATVVLAIAMFFGGVGQVFKLRAVRLVLMAGSVLACVLGLIKVLSLPIA
jgi:hypothetical protein